MEIDAAPSPIDRALALAVDVHAGVLDQDLERRRKYRAAWAMLGGE